MRNYVAPCVVKASSNEEVGPVRWKGLIAIPVVATILYFTVCTLFAL